MYIKATKEECEAYDEEVTQGESYSGNTIRWETPQEIEGDWYISIHPNYPTELTTVESKPIIEDEFI